MEPVAIGCVAAMPEEIAPLLRRIKGHHAGLLAGHKVYRFQVGVRPVLLMESGMGPAHAAAAAAALIEHAAPELILNFGFAGAVRPGLAVGDLVLAQRVFWLEGGSLSQAPPPSPELSGRVARVLQEASLPVQEGSFVTAAGITRKEAVAGVLEPSLPHPVLEMETAALLRVAADAGVPLLALRGISDAAEEELGFSLDEFCDAELSIRPWRVLGTVARKPWIIPQLIRLAGNSKRAGETLALGVELALKELAGEVGRRS